MILVVGGTGNIGTELVKGLRAAGADFKLLLRPGSAPIADIESVVGDLSDRASLDAALDGVDKAFLVSSPHPDAVTLQSTFIDACVDAKVSHLVKSSVYGAETPTETRFIEAHRKIEAHLFAAGLPYTLLRPNLFHQTTLASLAAIKTGVLPQPQGDGAVSSVDVRDIAAVAVTALLKDGHIGKAYELTGPEALTSEATAKLIAAAAGYPVQYIDVDRAEYVTTLLGYGLGDFMASGLAELYDYYKAGRAARVSSDVETVTGSPARSYEAWLSESRPLFTR